MDARTATWEGFANWLATLDSRLAAFAAALPPHLAAQLDYSPDSLDALEHGLLAAPVDAVTLNNAAGYVGETLRRALGGQWAIQLEDASRAYAGVPVIVSSDYLTSPVCPEALVRLALSARTGTVLSDRLRFHLRYGASRHPNPANARRICKICEG